MASKNEMIFSLTGPSFLSTLHWNKWQHRRSVAASLVKGVYSLERDRRHHRQGHEALAPPWWLFFNFKLVQTLVDSHDGSFFAAVYEFTHFPNYHTITTSTAGQRPPRYVIAFRGTINKSGNREEDFKLNLHLIINNLRSCTRFQIGFETASGLVQRVGPGNVWLAGHSMGSSLALAVGREMIKDFGHHLETYLFNPPFASPPIQRLKSKNLKLGIRFANSLFTAALATAVDYVEKRKRKTSHAGSKEEDVDYFALLSTWTPYLFINPRDPICGEYAGYFKHREDMEAIGAAKIGRIATKHSIGSLLSYAAGINKDSEALHLIPSAYLTINATPSLNFKEAHGIQQWWNPDFHFDYKYYQHK